MIALAKNPAVLDPRAALTKGQIEMLRRLDIHGAGKVRGGWKCGGHYHRAATLRPLLALDLLREEFRNGRHRLALTYAGRMVVDRLAPATTGPALDEHGYPIRPDPT